MHGFRAKTLNTSRLEWMSSRVDYRISILFIRMVGPLGLERAIVT